MESKNEVILRGWILIPFEFHHATGDIEIYRGLIQTKRKSGTEDVLPIHITSEQLGYMKKVPEAGDFVEVKGAFNSRNFYDEDAKKHLMLYVQVKSIVLLENVEQVSENRITIAGRLVSRGVARNTASGRIVVDFQLATLRRTNRRSCIPCIAWGKYTNQIEDLDDDADIEVIGRIQSRNYTKVENGREITKTVYEVSVTEFV